jgi:hypothetical protein
MEEVVKIKLPDDLNMGPEQFCFRETRGRERCDFSHGLTSSQI